MDNNILSINGKHIGEVWYSLLLLSLQKDFTYKIKDIHGNFRYQFKSISIGIEKPEENIVNEEDPNYKNFTLVTIDNISHYFAKYVMSDESLEPCTYGSRIHQYLPTNETQYTRVIDILKTKPYSNEAVIEVASPLDLDLCIDKDKNLCLPRLRLIDFKVIPHEDTNILNVHLYFRSLNLLDEFIVILGSMELLKQLVASECEYVNGSMYVYTSALYVYEDYLNVILRYIQTKEKM